MSTLNMPGLVLRPYNVMHNILGATSLILGPHTHDQFILIFRNWSVTTVRGTSATAAVTCAILDFLPISPNRGILVPTSAFA